MTTIYHNPNCGTSRNVLAMLRDSGEAPEVVEYLKAPPSRDTIRRLIADAGLTLRQAIREKGTPYAELGLADPSLTDEALLDAIEAHPILLNRPFVVSDKGTRLCRPSEMLFEIMANPPSTFTKEDGEVVIR